MNSTGMSLCQIVGHSRCLVCLLYLALFPEFFGSYSDCSVQLCSWSAPAGFQCAGVDQWKHYLWKPWLEMEFVSFFFLLIFPAFHQYESIATNTLTDDTVQDFEMVQGHFLFVTLFHLVVKLKICTTSQFFHLEWLCA